MLLLVVTYGISEKGRTPTGEDTSDALGAIDFAPCVKVALVHF
jgi:hypothetical protein